MIKIFKMARKELSTLPNNLSSFNDSLVDYVCQVYFFLRNKTG